MKKVIWKVLRNHWVVNLVTTTIGVYLGIFISNYYDKKSAIERTESAFDKVKIELIENYKEFVKWDSTSQANYTAVEFMVDNREEDDSFIMTTSEMDIARRKYADFLAIEDSTLIRLDTFKYTGSFEIDINSPLLLSPGSNTSWLALKSSDYFNYLDFDCINRIENFYYAFQYSFDQRILWFNKFIELVRRSSINAEPESEDTFKNKLFMKELLFEWKRENDFNKSMIMPLSEFEEKLNNCIEY